MGIFSLPQEKSVWNWLEVTKLIVSTLTPLSILALTAIMTRRTAREAEKRQAAEREQAAESTRYRKVIEKRVELWDKIGPDINDIYAYAMRVGNWNNLRPEEIIGIKRQCDKCFYSYKPFFSEAFSDAYLDFMKANFKMFNGMGEDAKIRASTLKRKITKPDCFTEEVNEGNIHRAYAHILEIASEELGVSAGSFVQPPKPSIQ